MAHIIVHVLYIQYMHFLTTRIAVHKFEEIICSHHFIKIQNYEMILRMLLVCGRSPCSATIRDSG